MRKTLRAAVVVAFAAILLTGCRYSATYTINADNTVSGRIYTAGWLDPGDASAHDTIKAYIDGDADTIADAFTTSVKSQYIDGDWYGYFIDITDEPLPSFAAAPQAVWDIQIIRTGPTYRVNGYEFADDDDPPRPSARDNSGYLKVDVRMPGDLTFAVSASSATESPARVQWDFLNVVPVGTMPYATSDNSPAPPPDPDPVVTVVIPPDPDPVVTMVVTPSASAAPSPSPSATPIGTNDGDSIPVWVWATGGALVVALAGTVGYAVANRKPPVETPPAAKPKAKAKDEPADVEPEDDEPDEDEPEEETKPAPKKKK